MPINCQQCVLKVEGYRKIRRVRYCSPSNNLFFTTVHSNNKISIIFIACSVVHKGWMFKMEQVSSALAVWRPTADYAPCAVTVIHLRLQRPTQSRLLWTCSGLPCLSLFTFEYYRLLLRSYISNVTNRPLYSRRFWDMPPTLRRGKLFVVL